jgi:hypothetical protein
LLFLHETHEVVGASEAEFEETVREHWQPAVARSEGARLLAFLHHAHGTGASYRVVTLTALRDGSTWAELVERVDSGDLRSEAERLDALRHDVTGKILVPLPWSPLQEVDLGPHRTPPEGQAALFMEDTVWPYEGRLEAYVMAAGTHYASELGERAKAGRELVRLEAGFRTAFGSHRRREVVLWQRVVRPEGLVPLLTHEVPARYKRPGGWMHDALELRDRWESRLLRAAAWSPWA